MIPSSSLPVGVSSACSVMETTRTPLRRSMDLKATACSRLRVKRENFQTRIRQTQLLQNQANGDQVQEHQPQRSHRRWEWTG